MRVWVGSRCRGIEILYFHVNTLPLSKQVRILKPWVEVNIGKRVPRGQAVIFLLGRRDCTVASRTLYCLLGYLTKIANVCVNCVRYGIDWTGLYGTPYWLLRLTLRSIYRVTGSSLVDCVWNVMAHAQKPDFVFRRNGQVHLNRRGASVKSTTGSQGFLISASNGSNAGYTKFRGSVKSTSYPLHSPVSP